MRRADGTNPSAGTRRDRERVARLKARAFGVLHARGETWCPRCGDDGVIEGEGGAFGPCGCGLTSREAQAILDGLDYAPTLREIERARRRAG